MEPLLSTFRLRPYHSASYVQTDLWPTAPRFSGNPRIDPPVNSWLKDIKAGCIERSVPRDYWACVGLTFLGRKARDRVDEVEKVMKKMHGGKWIWTWKRFKVAMRNMGWSLEYDKKEHIEVEARPSLLWWFMSKPASDPDIQQPEEKVLERPPIKGSETSFWLSRKLNFSGGGQGSPKSDKAEIGMEQNMERPPSEATRLSLRSSVSSFFTAPSQENKSKETKTLAEKEIKSTSTTKQDTSSDSVLGTGLASAPTWLLNVCQSLDTLHSEHPKVMSMLSAILITAGTLPTLPAVIAGGTVSSAVQAAGAVALGVGNWLQSKQVENTAGGKGEKESIKEGCRECGK